MKKTKETIAAISTSTAAAGIGIVRISGEEAFAIADKIFKSGKRCKLSKFKSHTINHGWIVDRTKKQDELIDEVLVSKMDAPFTYTKENTVEINCHGGIVGLRRILELTLQYGCRLAEPGEFT